MIFYLENVHVLCPFRQYLILQNSKAPKLSLSHLIACPTKFTCVTPELSTSFPLRGPDNTNPSSVCMATGSPAFPFLVSPVWSSIGSLPLSARLLLTLPAISQHQRTIRPPDVNNASELVLHDYSARCKFLGTHKLLYS